MFQPSRVVPADGRLLLYTLGDEPPSPEAARRVGLAGVEDKARLALPVDGEVRIEERPVLAVGLADAVAALRRLPTGAPAPWRTTGSDAVRAWALASHIALELVQAGRLLPALSEVDGTVYGTWRAALAAEPRAVVALDQLAAALPPSAVALATCDDQVWHPRALLTAFCDAVADLAVRAANPDPAQQRPRARLLPWTARWAEALADGDDPVVPLSHDADELVSGVDGWLQEAIRGDDEGVVELGLQPPPGPDGPWRLRFGVRDPAGVYDDAATLWSDTGEGARARQDVLLRGLGHAATLFPPLDAVLDEPAPGSLALSTAEAAGFLDRAAPLLREAGLRVHVPEELREDALRLVLRLGTGPLSERDDAAEQPGPQAAGDRPAATGYRWEVAVEGEVVDEDQLVVLAERDVPLVHLHGRWLRADPERARRLATVPDGGRLGVDDALALSLLGEVPAGDHGLPGMGKAPSDQPIDVVTTGGVATLVERLRGAGAQPPAAVTPPGFVGTLRDYQRRGVAWLEAMGEVGFGAVLADDMGLGKTVELIGFLLARRATTGSQGPWLVVCPTSVVGNWERELERFAPDLPVLRQHGTERPDELTDVPGVVLTTYGTLRRDAAVLATVHWDVVALDEAQQVKNPRTAGARAVRSLSANHRVALTGTPLENRLTELWNVMDICNPGLLGSRAAFGRRFVGPVEQRRDTAAAARLRRLVTPFVLRREKTDPAIVSDLPDKIERVVACGLTSEQAELYQAELDRVLDDALQQSSRMQRRGRILALLTMLKQICNHPAHALDEPPDAARLSGRSGKLAAAREIVAEATDAGDQVLVFTQFVAMGRLLVAQLSADLGVPVPFLHGKVPVAQRDALVARFQGEDDGACVGQAAGGGSSPVLVVSLRAGGLGLNLTAASHVVHYDRWWNPAVEDQATDRTHRIGQHRTVQVHKLVTAGTVEERIAGLLERKRDLAARIVGAGESWVTELGEDELRELVALSGPVVDVDHDWDDVRGEVQEDQ